MFLVQKVRCLALAVFILTPSVLTASAPPLPASAQVMPSVQVAPDRYIVKLRPSVSTGAFAAAVAYESKPGVEIDQVYSSVFIGFAGEFTQAALTMLLNDPNVEMITADYVVQAAAQTVPPGIQRVGADLNPTEAGNGSGSVSIDVAVLDTGVAQDSDLNVVDGKDCIESGSPFSDVVGHGTHVAGTIGAIDNGVGVVGVAPNARIWAVKVLGDDGFGSNSSIICGLDYVASRSSTIEVANMSLSGYTGPLGDSCSSDAAHFAICDVVSRGVTIVVAAGNESANAANYFPAQFNEVITVSAYYDNDGAPGGKGGCNIDGDCDDQWAWFSNYGADVDIAAPGIDIESTSNSGGTEVMSGTSMAAPHVAGGAALIIAQRGLDTPAEVKSRLLLTAEPGPVTGDPDSYKEPRLNIAMLGIGKIVAPTSGKVGETIQVRVGDMTPGTRAIFRFDGVYIGGDDVDDEGRASLKFMIPARTKGIWAITVKAGFKTVSANFKVNPLIKLSPTSGPVGTTVNVSLRGFGSHETVSLTFDTGNGNKSLGEVTVSTATGSVNTSFVVPPSTDGAHHVTATGNMGSSPHVNFSTTPSAILSDTTLNADQSVRVTIRGFKAGEAITIRYNTQGGVVLGTFIASATGSGSKSVVLPETVTNGNHYLWVMGDQGNRIRLAMSVSGAGVVLPTATASVTATATMSPTSSGTPTETSTETVSPPSIETASETPTAIATDTPASTATDTPTEVPTVAPTETSAEVPTDTPTADVPSETPTVEIPTDTPTPV